MDFDFLDFGDLFLLYLLEDIKLPCVLFNASWVLVRKAEVSSDLDDAILSSMAICSLCLPVKLLNKSLLLFLFFFLFLRLKEPFSFWFGGAFDMTIVLVGPRTLVVTNKTRFDLPSRLLGGNVSSEILPMSSIRQMTPLGEEGVKTNKYRGDTKGSSHPKILFSLGSNLPTSRLLVEALEKERLCVRKEVVEEEEYDDDDDGFGELLRFVGIPSTSTVAFSGICCW